MKVVITGSAGHLGEALVRHYRARGADVVGLDVLPSPTTDAVGSIRDRALVDRVMRGADAILHTATLHKPHVATHAKQDFIDVNVSGTQVLLEVAVAQGVRSFVFTSTTSTFGNAMAPGEAGATWVTEQLRPIPKNIYGVTKVAAEDLCQLAHQEHGLPCLILKTSRFFPEDDDMKHTMAAYEQDNIKAIEFLHRRVDVEDVVEAHAMAVDCAPRLGFDKFIISATTPFAEDDCPLLAQDAPAVLARYFPDYPDVFAARGWKMFPRLGRVYVNQRARERLGWRPRHDFAQVLARLAANGDVLSPLAYRIGAKGYHRAVGERA